MALQWADTLWEGQEGYVAVATGRPVLREGKYKHLNFRQHWAVWPMDRERIAVNSIADSSQKDVYIAPMLRSKRSRAAGTGIGGRWSWVDVDVTPTGQAAEALEAVLTGCSTMQINSGRGQHLYVDLGAFYPRDEVEELNRWLASAVGGDSKWSENSILRLPGCLSHKPTFFEGRPPALVHRIVAS